MEYREKVKCCIGTSDLVAEFIDDMFDDQEPKWNADNYVGFIGGDAVVLTYKDNRIIVKYTTGDMDGVRRAAQSVLDEMDCENPDEEGWKRKAFVVDKEVRLRYVK